MLTKQQIFNKVVKHLLKQNKRVPGSGWVGDKGELCVAACLIKPSLRKGWTSDNYYDHKQVPYALIDSGIDVHGSFGIRGFVYNLMDIHDGNKPSRWPRMLRAVGRKHNLKLPLELTEAK